MEALVQDARYAARQLLTHRRFTIAAALLLGLGIGANTTMFAVVERVLLRPLPYRAPDELVMVWERNLPRQVERNIVSPQNYLDWKERAHAFRDLAAFTWSQMVLTGGDSPERIYGRSVTPNLFAVLGATPALGRTFTPEEGRPNGPAVVILSDALWRRRFGAEAGIVGRTIRVSGGDVRVVGVMPPSFRPLATEEYWDPFQLEGPGGARHGRYAMVLGRLKPGITRDQAERELTGIAAQLEREYPEFNSGWSASVIGLTDQVVGPSKRVLWVLFGAVSLVLLITCANVANLMLTRATSRQREVAVRTALGAPRWRLARQWLLENLMLATIGGVVGLLLASYAVAFLVAAGPQELPRSTEIALDRRIVLGTAAVTLFVGLVIGLPAAFQGRVTRLAAELHGSSTRSTGGVRAARFRSALVVTQMSLAVVLLLASGLLVRSIERLTRVDPGFDPSHVLTLGVNLPHDRYPDVARGAAFFSTFAERLAALPGVQGVGGVSFLPLQNGDAATSFTVIGRSAPAPGDAPVASIRVADAGYFAAMRIPLERGRLATAQDRPATPHVVMVSAALAKKIWPDEEPIGQRIKIAYANSDDVLEVVGVVGDVRHAGLDADVRETIYYPATQFNYGSLTMVLRSAGPPEALAPAVRLVLHEMDRDIPAEDLATMANWLDRSMSDRRDPMVLLTIFAALAVTIAAVGVYAVLSFAVSMRTREIGVRMALGAQSGDVLAMVLRGGLRLTALGVAFGAVAGMLGARALDRLLFHVTPADPLTLAIVGALLITIAMFAMYLPARRAARVDPMVALRDE